MSVYSSHKFHCSIHENCPVSRRNNTAKRQQETCVFLRHQNSYFYYSMGHWRSRMFAPYLLNCYFFCLLIIIWNDGQYRSTSPKRVLFPIFSDDTTGSPCCAALWTSWLELGAHEWTIGINSAGTQSTIKGIARSVFPLLHPKATIPTILCHSRRDVIKALDEFDK
jgi:hypothetical protein